jgi:hypothetical protein
MPVSLSIPPIGGAAHREWTRGVTLASTESTSRAGRHVDAVLGVSSTAVARRPDGSARTRRTRDHGAATGPVGSVTAPTGPHPG